jgi:hypothetical protein
MEISYLLLLKRIDWKKNKELSEDIEKPKRLSQSLSTLMNGSIRMTPNRHTIVIMGSTLKMTE